jgi:hypothetical protein
MFQIEWEDEKTLRVKLIEKRAHGDESFAKTFQNTKMFVAESLTGEEMTVVRQGQVKGATLGLCYEWNFVIRKAGGETKSFVAPFFDAVMAYHYYTTRVVPSPPVWSTGFGRSSGHSPFSSSGGWFGPRKFSALGGDKFGASPPEVPDGPPVPDEVDTPQEALDVDKRSGGLF